MTPEAFRKLALALPHTTEKEHMGHPDFRVKNKVFASLWPDGESAMVKLTPTEQKRFTAAHPSMFSPVKGAWGEKGCTQVHLKPARTPPVREALTLAWRITAPKAYLEDLAE
jgi:hypothetical protein